MAAEEPAKKPAASPYRRVTFHDSQRHAETGIGKYTKSWTIAKYAPGELEKLIEEHRVAQKAKNDAYRKAARGEADRALVAVENIRLPPPPAPPGVTHERSLDLHLDPGTGNSTVLFGSSKAGKSTTMMYLFRRYYGGAKQITTLFACSPQAPVYEGGDAKKADRLVHVTGYDPRLIRLAQAINRGTDNHYEFCFMLDDIIDQRQDATLARLILTLRNSKLSSLVCLQGDNLLAKQNRGNVNNVLLFRYNSDELIMVAIDHYLKSHFRRMGIALDNMVAFYREVTADYGFIYVRPAAGTISFHRLRL